MYIFVQNIGVKRRTDCKQAVNDTNGTWTRPGSSPRQPEATTDSFTMSEERVEARQQRPQDQKKFYLGWRIQWDV
jgi:hypothetical protein